MNTRILYLGSARDFDTYTARLLLDLLHAQTGNRALWVNSGGRGMVVIRPK